MHIILEKVLVSRSSLKILNLPYREKFCTFAIFTLSKNGTVFEIFSEKSQGSPMTENWCSSGRANLKAEFEMSYEIKNCSPQKVAIIKWHYQQLFLMNSNIKWRNFEEEFKYFIQTVSCFKTVKIIHISIFIRCITF